MGRQLLVVAPGTYGVVRLPGEMAVTFLEHPQNGNPFGYEAQQRGLKSKAVDVGSQVLLNTEDDFYAICRAAGIEPTPLDVMPNGAWTVTMDGGDLTLTVFLPPALRSGFAAAARAENFTPHPTATGFALNMISGVGEYFNHGQQICRAAGFVAPTWDEWKQYFTSRAFDRRDA
jgi:hypothetical protein